MDGPDILFTLIVAVACAIGGCMAGCDATASTHCKAVAQQTVYRIEKGRIICQQIVDVPEK